MRLLAHVRRLPHASALCRLPSALCLSWKVPLDRLCLALRYLHGHLAPLAPRLDVCRGIEAEDVLGTKLGLNAVVDALQFACLFDIERRAAGFAAETVELVTHVAVRVADADADGEDR